ncbi:MAG: 4-hydroxybenzoate solanesyltransferase [Turneriella sp.]|nr:4-hydroxybenzoate solanesyltransferase [Turneriella sp.]
MRMIKFSHTLFALPFALAAVVVIYTRYPNLVSLPYTKILWILAAFTGMRSFAMAVNRIADRAIDAKNPRTQNREIPVGALSVKAVAVFAFISLGVLCISAYMLSPLAAYLALPAAIAVAFYSYTKRFTWLCHFWLGFAIGMAPLAVYIALIADIRIEAILMGASLAFYIAGFDILYALQDIAFDKENGVYSIPARFGIHGAMWISRVSHSISLFFIGLLIYFLHLNFFAWIFFILLTGLFVTEHLLVGSAKNPLFHKIPVAFFHVNSAFSFVFLSTIAVGIF